MTSPDVALEPAPASSPSLPALVGSDLEVPLVDGGTRRYVNLDWAASTPALVAVAQAVAELLPWYSSVHRGAGFKSRVSTALYEAARDAIRSFLGVPDELTVLLTRNTTDSINLLASCLPDGTRIVSTAAEHHADMLPWRRREVVYLPVPSSPADLLAGLAAALRDGRPGQPSLVAVTGASNVTGELWPLAEIVALAHEHGARVLVDAAQLAPHAPIDMGALGADYLAASGHKLYAPFGVGILAGRGDWLSAGPPFLRGGGAVAFVTLDDVEWRPLPDRQEAGSPNVLGAVALGVACRTLEAVPMSAVAAEEMALHRYGRARLAAVPGLQLYSTWDPELPRIGLLAFNLSGYDHGELAAILSAEHGVAVRHGCFCAHPLVAHLLRLGDRRTCEIRDAIRRGEAVALPGAVRISMGLGTTRADLDAAVDALTSIAAHGPRWRYRLSDETGDVEPDPDPRPWPLLPLAPQPALRPAGESS